MSSYIKFLLRYLFLEPAESLRAAAAAQDQAALAEGAQRSFLAATASGGSGATSQNNNSELKLWPSKCLEFARMFASELVRQQRSSASAGASAAASESEGEGESQIAPSGQTEARASPAGWWRWAGGAREHLSGASGQMASLSRRPPSSAPAHSGGPNNSLWWPARRSQSAAEASLCGSQARHPNELEDLIRSALEEAKLAGAAAAIQANNATTTNKATTTSWNASKPFKLAAGASLRARTTSAIGGFGGFGGSGSCGPLGHELELAHLECLNQLQLRDYYSKYDICVGLRIATTLSSLFIVFILFVVYKTGWRAGGSGKRATRSQLRLVSSSGDGGRRRRTKAASRRRASALLALRPGQHAAEARFGSRDLELQQDAMA